MRREDFVIEGIPPGYQVWDVDLSLKGRVACVLASPPDANGPDHLSDLPLSEVPPLVMVNGKPLPVPNDSARIMGDLHKHVMTPSLRWAGEDRLVTFGRRTSKDKVNAWAILLSGEVEAAFHAGDAIQDVLANDHLTVVTYFDEGILGGSALDALAVLDLTGTMLAGYGKSMPKSVRMDIWDCYCACLSGSSEVTFYPYGQPNFPLVRWDFKSLRQQDWITPEELHGSAAISSIGNVIFFHSPYESSGLKGKILRWEIGSKYFDEVGEYPDRRRQLRGLPDGRFIAPNPNGYTILSFD